MTLIQSRSFVYPIFKFNMYSFMIKVAILVNKAVLLEIIIPTPELIKPHVEQPIADPYPIKFSVIVNNLFFLFSDFYFFL